MLFISYKGMIWYSFRSHIKICIVNKYWLFWIPLSTNYNKRNTKHMNEIAKFLGFSTMHYYAHRNATISHKYFMTATALKEGMGCAYPLESKFISPNTFTKKTNCRIYIFTLILLPIAISKHSSCKLNETCWHMT